jgi:hypothetical protein
VRANNLLVLGFVCVTACGGAGATFLGSDAGADASSDAQPGGGDDAPRSDAAAGSDAGTDHVDGGGDADNQRGDAGQPDAHDDAGPDAPEEACTPTLLYRDDDGDGYGGSVTFTGCSPDAGTWVSVGGDCDDSNAQVHPGQTAYFSTGYVPSGQSATSFDYNCDGQETESGSPPKLDCQAMNVTTCTGDGYIPATPARSGTGVDPYCGSDQSEHCAFVGLSCTAGAPQQASPIACH